MAVHLVNNNTTNPYYNILQAFFDRQVILKGNVSLISGKNLSTGLIFSGHNLLVKDDRTNQKVFFENSFRFDKNNQDEKIQYLQNHLILHLLAQSFEYFERFMKDLYQQYITLNPSQSIVPNKIPRNNLDLIRELKKISNTIGIRYTDDFHDWFKVMEEVRHKIIHSDQIVTKQFVQNNNGKHSKDFFTFIDIGNGNFRITSTKEQVSEAIGLFNQTGFDFFSMLSKDTNYPVEYSSIAKPKSV